MDDEYVAKLMAKEAAESSKKYSLEGLGAYQSHKRDINAPRANTRFLRHLIKETDSHNTALKRKEEREARDRMRAHELGSKRLSPAPGIHEREPSSTKDSSRRHRDDHRHSRHSDRRGDRRDDRRDDRHGSHSRSHRKSYRRRSRSRSSERDRSHKHRRRDDDDDSQSKDTSKGKEHRDRRREANRDRSREDDRGREDRRSRRSTTHRRRPTYSESRSRSPRRDRSAEPDRRRRHKSPSGRRSPHPQRTQERRSRRGDERRSPKGSQAVEHSQQKHSAIQGHEIGDESDPLEDMFGPLPPPLNGDSATTVRSRGRGAYKPSSSNIDSHFAPDYDPTVDVQPDEDESFPSQPARRPVAGLMTQEDDWDMALEAVRDRARWKQQGEDRLRAAGINESIIERWKDNTSSNGSGSEKKPEDVRWSKKGEGREWDRGKVMDDQGHTDVHASW